MENADVARTLHEMADILELTGGNAFKVRAYRQAARMIEALPRPIAELVGTPELRELPGIGAHMAEHIAALLEQGTFPEYEAIRERVPHGVLELLRVEGLGPKGVAAVWKTLGITDLHGLESACHDGRILEVARMGPTRVRTLLDAIDRYRARLGRTPIHVAMPYADAILARLRAVPGVVLAEACGSLRRRVETVGDLDLLVASDDPEPVMRAFLHGPGVAHTIAQGTTRSAVRLTAGLQVDLRVVSPTTWGAALHYFTGSKAHNIALRTRAVRMGIKLSEYGVFNRRGRRLGGASEQEVFHHLHLPFIPPELREGAGEIEAAEAGRLPRLVEETDLLGDLHVHSDASSDAHSTLDELHQQARRLGRRYLAITDHSRSRPLGLDAAALRRHTRHIHQFNNRNTHAPRLLAGIEVDILASGALDLPLEDLQALDCVVASVHSNFHQPGPRMTERIITALRTGVVDILGHPTGRQLGARDAYALDLERILEVAREEGVAVEVNAQPDRMDLDARGCRLAKQLGVQVTISSDAHHVSHLDNLRYGVFMARRGWLEASDVVTSLTLPAVRRRLRRHHPVPARSARSAGAHHHGHA